MRAWVTTALEVSGLSLIVAGVSTYSVTLGLISAGVALLVIGVVNG